MSCIANNDLCRLCQQHPGAYNVYIPDPVHTSSSPAARIMWVTQLQLIDGDGLPNEICRQCWIQLNAAYGFIEQCLATDKALRTRSSQSQPQDSPIKAESMLEVNIREEDDYNSREYDAYNSAETSLPKSCTSDNEGHIKVEMDDSLSYDSVSNEPSMFVCSICEGSFERKRAYIMHMQLHASEMAPPLMFQVPKPHVVPQMLQCELCSKTFSVPSHLKRHVRKHTGDKPYKCTLCEKAFYRQDHLTKHFRSHTGERPFQCTLCGRSFARRDHLANHVKVHARVKPFSCALCAQTFFKQSGLVKHLKKHPPV